MIKGIGMDIVEIDRIQAIVDRQPKFISRILTEQESLRYSKLKGNRRYEYFAGRYAAKEAFSKAWGTGIGKELSFLDIEISAEPNGKPYFSKPLMNGVHLSITHSKEFAAAQVVIEEKE